MYLLLFLICSHITITFVKCNFDKPKVVSRSQRQKLTTWFSLKLQRPTTPTLGKVSKKQYRAIHSEI